MHGRMAHLKQWAWFVVRDPAIAILQLCPASLRFEEHDFRGAPSSTTLKPGTFPRGVPTVTLAMTLQALEEEGIAVGQR